MAELKISTEWLSTGEREPILRDTSAQLAIYVDDTCITRNVDAWSKTVRESVLVSTYPLAHWLATSWWRLSFEPLAAPGAKPDLNWRMAHELGAANHGYVWPRILFAPDGECVNIWAERLTSTDQSINYLNDLRRPKSVKIETFQRQIAGFIESVINRLDAVGHRDTDLAHLWSIIKEDKADEVANRIRCLEARLGFDPEECPESEINEALTLQQKTGENAMSELAPVFGRRGAGTDLEKLRALSQEQGLVGTPEIHDDVIRPILNTEKPWMQGVDMARQLRSQLGDANGPIKDKTLYDLLGISSAQSKTRQASTDRKIVSIAKPMQDGKVEFVPRRNHAMAKRFEFARFLGEYLLGDQRDNEWMVVSDLYTAKQKRQRSFAAEFLCPINSLISFLDDNYSESAIEDASMHFKVSHRTVETLLTNNGYLSQAPEDARLPYSLAH